MSSLRTNYKDDVFTGKRKYSMSTNPDTTVSFEDETDYSQRGDTYGAAQINEANDIINNLDNNTYKSTDAAESTLADGDYFPFYDVSASAKKKTLFSTLKNTLLNTFAPKSHPSNTASVYGAGNASQYGHVKLSDKYTSSDGGASSSTGASSQAVYDAYRNRAPINHASNQTTYGRGSSSVYGHVKLSNTYNSNPGDADSGMAASGKAVYDAYADLSYAINGSNNRISTLENEFTANGTRLYMDYQGGKYGYNTSAARGADTFFPFRSPHTQTYTYIQSDPIIKDLTEDHQFRYINAQNVYNRGYNAGDTAGYNRGYSTAQSLQYGWYFGDLEATGDIEQTKVCTNEAPIGTWMVIASYATYGLYKTYYKILLDGTEIYNSGYLDYDPSASGAYKFGISRNNFTIDHEGVLEVRWLGSSNLEMVRLFGALYKQGS